MCCRAARQHAVGETRAPIKIGRPRDYQRNLLACYVALRRYRQKTILFRYANWFVRDPEINDLLDAS